MPVMERYLASLTELLADPAEGLGLAPDVPVMVMEASGGLMTVAARARKAGAHRAVGSGRRGRRQRPCRRACRALPTSSRWIWAAPATDISLILDGRPQVTREASLDRTPIRIPVIDINAIGAGGGSIAWIDEGGALRVGPMSAEAVPGPACYGRGGTEPTVTDANLVLGRLGGRHQARRRARARWRGRGAGHRPSASPARSVSISSRAAAGILRVANATMARGIRVVSVERGHDPRAFDPGAVRRRRADARLALGARAWRSRASWCRRPRVFSARSGCWSPICGTIWCRRGSARISDLSAADARAVFAPMLDEARRLLGRRPGAGGTAARSRCGSTCAISANPMNCRSRSLGSPTPRGRRWRRAFHAEHLAPLRP